MLIYYLEEGYFSHFCPRVGHNIVLIFQKVFYDVPERWSISFEMNNDGLHLYHNNFTLEDNLP